MIILVTGVSSGFGKAIAQALVANGHKVFGTVRRNVDPMEGVTYLQADVQNDAQIAAAFDQMMKLTDGRIDVFINNAGIGIGGPIEFCKIEDVQKQMDVNFMGMVRWLSHVVPAMRKQGFGKILCISSIGGLIGLPLPRCLFRKQVRDGRISQQDSQRHERASMSKWLQRPTLPMHVPSQA